MSSASKVGEIFTAAGTAFTKLGELTMQLHTSNGGGSTKWTEEDIALMHTCLTKFANEIDEISSRVRLRTMTHINSTVRKKEYDDAGLILSSPHSSLNSVTLSSTSSGISMKGNSRKGGKKVAIPSSSSSSSIVSSAPSSHLSPVSSPPPHSEEVTLNMLNASDPDSYLKIDFDSSGSS